MVRQYRVSPGCSVGFKQPGEIIDLEESDARIHLAAGRIQELKSESPHKAEEEEKQTRKQKK